MPNLEEYLEANREDLPTLLATVAVAVHATRFEEKVLQTADATSQAPWASVYELEKQVSYATLAVSDVITIQGHDGKPNWRTVLRSHVLHAILRFRVVHGYCVLFVGEAAPIAHRGLLLEWLRRNLPEDVVFVTPDSWAVGRARLRAIDRYAQEPLNKQRLLWLGAPTDTVNS